jgi:hypothetical protein
MGTQVMLPQAFETSLAEFDDRQSRQGSRSRALAPASRSGYVRDCRRVASWCGCVSAGVNRGANAY